MAKSNSILNNKYTVVVLGVIALIVVVNAVTGSSSSSSTTSSTPTSGTSSNTRKQSLYTKEDYTASFSPLVTNATRDIFKPLVASNASPTGSNLSANTDIPTIMTSNEPNWAFTGTAQLNGSKQALFENSVTGNSAYVSIGEHWKSSTCESIQGDNVTLKADNGPTLTLLMQADQKEILAEKTANNAPLIPPISPTTQMAPGMMGPIGNGFQVQPLQKSQSSAVTATPAAPAVQPSGRKFRRRGRGRFGG